MAVKALTLMAIILTMLMGGCVANKMMVRAIEVTEGRAPFDMECDDVTSQLLGDATYPGTDILEVNIGVTGCGRRASYFTRCTLGNLGAIVCTPHLNSITGGKSLTTTEE
ncbi:MAG: hypothetical protein LBU70_05635 [Chitinispirillales bacterium]|jgi:hypothetical protein|nr:hypothetical protein [Chitinispirillales bacterium]